MKVQQLLDDPIMATFFQHYLFITNVDYRDIYFSHNHAFGATFCKMQ